MPSSGADAFGSFGGGIAHRFVPVVESSFGGTEIGVVVVAPFFYRCVVGGLGCSRGEHRSDVEVFVEPALGADFDGAVGFAFVGNGIASAYRTAKTEGGVAVVEEFDLFGAEGIVVDADIVELTKIISGTHESEFDSVGGYGCIGCDSNMIPYSLFESAIDLTIYHDGGRGKSCSRNDTIRGGRDTYTICKLKKRSAGRSRFGKERNTVHIGDRGGLVYIIIRSIKVKRGIEFTSSASTPCGAGGLTGTDRSLGSSPGSIPSSVIIVSGSIVNCGSLTFIHFVMSDGKTLVVLPGDLRWGTSVWVKNHLI